MEMRVIVFLYFFTFLLAVQCRQAAYWNWLFANQKPLNFSLSECSGGKKSLPLNCLRWQKWHSDVNIYQLHEKMSLVKYKEGHSSRFFKDIFATDAVLSCLITSTSAQFPIMPDPRSQWWWWLETFTIYAFIFLLASSGPGDASLHSRPTVFCWTSNITHKSCKTPTHASNLQNWCNISDVAAFCNWKVSVRFLCSLEDSSRIMYSMWILNVKSWTSHVLWVLKRDRRPQIHLVTCSQFVFVTFCVRTLMKP